MTMGWTQKCDIDDANLPIPTRIVSNEEFDPPDQTDEARIKSTGLVYMLYGGSTALVRLHMRFSMWNEAASEMEKAKTGDPTSFSEKYRSAMHAYLKGMASVENGRSEAARRSRTRVWSTSNALQNSERLASFGPKFPMPD